MWQNGSVVEGAAVKGMPGRDEMCVMSKPLLPIRQGESAARLFGVSRGRHLGIHFGPFSLSLNGVLAGEL